MNWINKIFAKKQQEYRILNAPTRWDLQNDVNEYLNGGWECLGGVSNMAIKTGGNSYDCTKLENWSQAMIKRK